MGVDRFLVSYSGNIGLTHPLEHLVESISLLDKEAPSSDIKFLITGHGSKRSSLQQLAKTLCIHSTRLSFCDPVPYEELQLALSAADFSVVALNGDISSASLPSKAFNALVCGTPLLVIAPCSSAIANLVFSYNCGIVVEPGPEAAKHIADYILYYYCHPESLRDLKYHASLASKSFMPSNASTILDCIFNV